MKTTDQELLSQWIDGELKGDEAEAFAARVADDPELSREAEVLRSIGSALRNVAEAEAVEPPSPEFFNRYLLHQIEEEDKEAGAPAPAPTAAPSPTPRGSLFGALLPWSVASIATVCAVFFALRSPGGAVAADHTQVTSVYSPVEGVETETYYAADADVTVILLEGLDDIPDEVELSGEA